MKKAFPVCLLLAAVSSAFGIGIGATYDEVIGEKGTPSGKLELNGVMMLSYPGQTLRIENGKVVSMKSSPVSQTTAAPRPVAVVRAPAAVPKPAPVVEQETSDLNWTTDYAGALATAKSQNRHVFLFFTGSDWCGWCMRLDHEILSTPEFKAYASENLILVKLDFPRKTMLPSDLAAQNNELGKKYRIEGFPTVVILDSNGRAVKQLGYREGGPNPFVATLKAL